jgi:RNA polymerase sigma-70 factor, ECF subfamily
MTSAGHEVGSDWSPTLTDDEHRRFEAIFRENVNEVMAFARRRTNPEDAKDVVSQTFSVAWRRLGDVPSYPLPWLFGVARNVLSEQRRSDIRQSALDERLADAAKVRGPSDHGDIADALIAQVGIRNALSRLRPSDRDVLTLVAWEGLNTTELATALGCTKATASLRLHRAQRRFVKHLEAEGATASPSLGESEHMALRSTAREAR